MSLTTQKLRCTHFRYLKHQLEWPPSPPAFFPSIHLYCPFLSVRTFHSSPPFPALPSFPISSPPVYIYIQYTGVTNMDTGDAAGDTYFGLSQLLLPQLCAVEPDFLWCENRKFLSGGKARMVRVRHANTATCSIACAVCSVAACYARCSFPCSVQRSTHMVPEVDGIACWLSGIGFGLARAAVYYCVACSRFQPSHCFTACRHMSAVNYSMLPVGPPELFNA